MKFCTRHDNRSVAQSTKFWNDMSYNGITLKSISTKFELRWKIVREMSPRPHERGPELQENSICLGGEYVFPILIFNLNPSMDK